MALVFRRFCGVEMVQFNGFGVFSGVPADYPVQADEWFALLRAAPFVGMTLLGLIDVMNYGLLALVFLSLFAALRKTDPVAMSMATLFGFFGFVIYLTSNQAFGMLTLSEKYFSASSAQAQASYLAAGEALLAMDGSGAVYSGLAYLASLFFVLLGGLIVSIIMLRSQLFSKATGVVGILANSLALLIFPAMALFPAILWLPPSLSAPFRLTWYVLIAYHLIKLANAEAKEGNKDV